MVIQDRRVVTDTEGSHADELIRKMRKNVFSSIFKGQGREEMSPLKCLNIEKAGIGEGQ